MSRASWIFGAVGLVGLVGLGLALSGEEAPQQGPDHGEPPTKPAPKPGVSASPSAAPKPSEPTAPVQPDKPEASNVVPYHKGASALKGLEFKLVSESEKAELGIPEKTQGMMITSVDPRSAAAEAKLKPGDVIVRANFQWLKNEADLSELVGDRKFTAVRVYRDGTPFEVVLHKPYQPNEAPKKEP